MKEFIIRYRLGIVLLSLLITVLSLLLFPKLKVNADIESYVPDSIENKVYLKQLDSIFGGSEMILVMFKAQNVLSETTLKRIQAVSEALAELEGVDRCISPFDTFAERGTPLDLLEELHADASPQKNALKKRISQNGMTSRFFSEDYELAALVLTKNSNSTDQIIEEIEQVLVDHPGEEETLLGGLPYIRYSIAGNISRDLIVLLPIALFLMVFMLYISFREWKGVFMPFVIVLISIILAFGVMAFLGWQISLFSILMPIMIIAIANDYGIHLIARYQELAKEDPALSMKDICKRIYSDLRRPIVITGLTTIGGVLGLLTHTMVPAAQLGVLTAIGIGFALLLSLWFLPALLSYFTLKKTRIDTNTGKTVFLDRILNTMGNWVVHKSKRIILISVLLGILGLAGTFLVSVDTNVESYFTGKSEVTKSITWVKRFGGSQFISVLFTGEVLSPEVLKRMEKYEQEIQKDPAVGLVSSPVSLVKELSKGFYEEDEAGYNQIPTNADEIYQLMEVFALGGNEEAISQFLDYDYENSRMLISLKDGSNAAWKRLLERLEILTKDDPNVSFAAGAGLTQIELADLVVNGQIKSLLFALTVIFILLSFVFRSPKAGLLSSLPLTIAIVLLFGLMGFFGIAVDIATALLSSIMIGVGVDYIIHFLWRFKEERKNGVLYEAAIRNTLKTSGRGIVINALSVVIGFTPLILSSFTPLRFFGALIVISISTCLISSLILVPAILVWVKPKFLEPK